MPGEPATYLPALRERATLSAREPQESPSGSLRRSEALESGQNDEQPVFHGWVHGSRRPRLLEVGEGVVQLPEHQVAAGHSDQGADAHDALGRGQPLLAQLGGSLSRLGAQTHVHLAIPLKG